MKRRTPNGWWRERSQRGQQLTSLTASAPTRVARTERPAYAPKGPAPLSSDHLTTLRLIRDRQVRASGLAAYYWTDRYMQAVRWIERDVLRFLKARKMIRKTPGGAFALTAIAVKLLTPAKRMVYAERNGVPVQPLSPSEALQRAAANIGARTVTA